MELHGLMKGLPNEYVLIHFHRFQQVKTAAKQVHDALIKNDGNQFIVVLGLTKTACQRLSSSKDCLDGIAFQFMWEEQAGLIKVVPISAHEVTTDAIRGEIEFICRSTMGIPRNEVTFGMATTHQQTVGNKGKEADQCFWPSSRLSVPGQQPGWPTLVIETGVTESLQRLREDAHWWFHNSLGEVRIVLVVCISRHQRKIIIEKWHLAPPGMPNQMTRSMLDQLVLIQRPPLVQQPVASQQPYRAQEIEIDPVSIQGAPLTLNFEAVFDRRRQQNESDIVMNANDLRHCTRII